MSARTARLLLALGAFVAGLVLFSTVIFIVTGRGPSPIAMPSAVGGPFNLVDQNGKSITDQDMKGKPFLVFFGFTHCPDVCPTTLFDVSEVFRALGADAKDVRALLGTYEQERDTPAEQKCKESNDYQKIGGF
jgi:protein SCO1/2